ncbi:MAG: hypothetical protein KGI02_03910 [Thaumarchaeota archaeon]|nr:hypothetical protein [Nitrososphaerota archaeon]MDE2589192.1 hypothetical protein [Patescibacteria group bacterium]
MSNTSDDTPTMTDSNGNRWNVHQPSLDAVRDVIAHIIESINNRTDLNGDQKHDMIMHLNGLNHADMAQLVQTATSQTN